MGSFADTTNVLMDYLNGHETINTVTFGDANEWDIAKSTNFPLAHLIPVSTSLAEGFSTYNYQILIATTYRSSKDDKIAIMDSMAEVTETVHKALVSGSLFQNQIRTTTNSTADPIYDERQNRVYGWSLSLAVTVPANIEICV